jgi:hypothetical protein
MRLSPDAVGGSPVDPRVGLGLMLGVRPVLAALPIAQQVPATAHNVRDGFTLYPSPQPAEQGKGLGDEPADRRGVRSAKITVGDDAAAAREGHQEHRTVPGDRDCARCSASVRS